MRLKDFILYGVMLFAAMSIGGCGEDNTIIDDSWNSGTLTVKEEVLLSGSNSQSLNIKASVKPVLECDASWLRIGEVRKLTTGIYSTELTAEVNTTGETRTAQVTVTAGKETATVKVIQVSGDVIEIRGIEPEGDLDPDGGTITIRYAATSAPAVNLPEWIRETGTRAFEEGVLSFTYTPNNSGREREGIIVLAVGRDAVANVTVRQGARTVAALNGKECR